jgi:preprotein translocase subunit SecG
MATVVLVIHLMIAAAMIGVVLLQKSEGGALGIGGGGGGFLTGRGTANLLTRATAILACAFFLTSIVLSILAARSGAPAGSLFDKPAGTEAGKSDAAPKEGSGVLDKLEQGRGLERLPAAPKAADQPASPSGPVAPTNK